MEKRYIGIDLHRNRFTCCIRLENERTYLTDWELEDLGKFVKKLRPADEIVFRRSGGACGARGGGEHESISSHPPIGEENRSQRRAHAGVVLIEEHVAGGAYEG